MSVKEAVIFDLDGTLCDISHRLHHIKGGNKDWNAFHQACILDVPKYDMMGLFHALDLKYTMYIVSGRSDSVRDQTLAWLRKHNVIPFKLIMRKHGDYTPDDVLKKSWLDDGTLPARDEILMAIDDRTRVVEMWRNEGITCLQCERWEEDTQSIKSMVNVVYPAIENVVQDLHAVLGNPDYLRGFQDAKTAALVNIKHLADN